MNAKVNRYVLTQTSWDSGLLTPLASAMHTFQQPGNYQGILFLGTETVGVFDLVVDEQSSGGQVDIDLEAVYRRRFSQTGGGDPIIVHPGQPTAFYVASGRGGYAVLVYRSEAGKKVPEFDSRNLRDGDVFTVTPVRRGSYSFTNNNAVKGEFQVQKKSGRSIPTEPVIIECVERGFKPDRASTEFSQPLFFVIRTPSRLKVQLKQADVPGIPGRPDRDR
jgi:hypothetical protein